MQALTVEAEEPPVPAAAPAPRLRAAVVGTGAIVSGSHLPALRAHGDRVELIAAVDVDTDRLKAFCETAGPDVTGYTDLDAMLAAERPDLVLIGTPPAFHRDQTVAALRAGAWVLCEKPPCLSLEEYDEIMAAEGAESGPYAAIVFQHRFGSGAVHARELLASGELGAPRVVHCQTTWHRDTAYYAVPWRGTWASEGGGPAMGHGIHQIDLMLDLLGGWSEIRAMAARLVHDVETEDVSVATVRFPDGALGTVVNSVHSPDEVSRIRIDCAEATLELTHLYGHENHHWHYTPAPHVTDTGRVDRWRNPATDVPSSHVAQIGEFLDAMGEGRRPRASGPDGRTSLEFVSALYKSAFTGQPVFAGEIGPGDPYYSRLHGGHPQWAPKGTGEETG
ncbi:Gfo/Idh/MocA family protein [Streptomyces sp.]